MLASLCLWGEGLYAQETSAVLTIEATVVEAIALSVSRSLNFGEVVAGTGIISVDRQNNDAGKFVLQGAANSTITISYTLPTNNQLLRAAGEGALGLIASIYGNTDDNPASAIELVDGNSVTLSSRGDYYFFVEGSLDVGPLESNPAGVYSGLLTMVIAYQ